MRYPTGVSNPHRYGQKRMIPLESLEAQYLFQTLIGTVKSPPPGEALSRLDHTFQTLIGTVKSREMVLLNLPDPLVSNPHRYGQKPPPLSPTPATTTCFKPS